MAWKAATISWDTLRGADALWDGLNSCDWLWLHIYSGILSEIVFTACIRQVDLTSYTTSSGRGSMSFESSSNLKSISTTAVTSPFGFTRGIAAVQMSSPVYFEKNKSE